MNPLHKTDSAISVASRDHALQDGKPSDHPPSSLSCTHVNPDESDSQSVTSDHRSPTSGTTDPPQEPLPPVVSRHSPTMENLIAPLDVAQRNPPPPFVDQPDSSWYQTQLSPPTPPTYDVDPAVSATPETAPYPSSPGHQSPSATTESYQEGHQEGHHDPDALAQAGSGAIVVDQDQLDQESDLGYESDRASYASTSLSSSVRDYLFENGRRYHRFREGRYNFPNDEPEQDREDMKHACVKMLCQDQLFFAPIEDGNLQNILDIGTGTGIWAIEMGDQFPSANVMGIDLSPIQPDWVPANVHFVVDDAESEWVYPEDHFDYIHTRHTVMAIKDWPKLYRTAKE